MPGMVLRPVGSHPPAVYWRRRVLILVAVLIVVVILVRACGGSAPAPRHRANGTGTAADSQVGNSATTGPTSCRAADLTAAVAPAPASAPAGSPVKFTGVITNTGAESCLLQITPSELVWVVRSGSTTVWNCPSQFSTQQTLAAHAGLRVRPATWKGRVGSPPGCSGSTAAQPGSYSVRLRLGRTRSRAVTFTLTGAGNSQG
jgi:hypothetical protein